MLSQQILYPARHTAHCDNDNYSVPVYTVTTITISCENNVLVVRQYVDCNPRTTTRQIDGWSRRGSIFLR